MFDGGFTGKFKDGVARALVLALDQGKDPDLTQAIQKGLINPPEGIKHNPLYANFVLDTIPQLKKPSTPRTPNNPQSKSTISRSSSTKTPSLIENFNVIMGDKNTQRVTYDRVIIDPDNPETRIPAMFNAHRLILDHVTRLVSTPSEQLQKNATRAVLTLTELMPEVLNSNNKPLPPAVNDQRQIVAQKYLVATRELQNPKINSEDKEYYTNERAATLSCFPIPSLPKIEFIETPDGKKQPADESLVELLHTKTQNIADILSKATREIGGSTIANTVLEIPTKIEEPLIYTSPRNIGRMMDVTRGPIDSLAFMVAMECVINEMRHRDERTKDRLKRRGAPQSFVFADADSIENGVIEEWKKRQEKEEAERTAAVVPANRQLIVAPPTNQSKSPPRITQFIKEVGRQLKRPSQNIEPSDIAKGRLKTPFRK